MVSHPAADRTVRCIPRFRKTEHSDTHTRICAAQRTDALGGLAGTCEHTLHGTSALVHVHACSRFCLSRTPREIGRQAFALTSYKQRSQSVIHSIYDAVTKS